MGYDRFANLIAGWSIELPDLLAWFDQHVPPVPQTMTDDDEGPEEEEETPFGMFWREASESPWDKEHRSSSRAPPLPLPAGWHIRISHPYHLCPREKWRIALCLQRVDLGSFGAGWYDEARATATALGVGIDAEPTLTAEVSCF